MPSKLVQDNVQSFTEKKATPLLQTVPRFEKLADYTFSVRPSVLAVGKEPPIGRLRKGRAAGQKQQRRDPPLAGTERSVAALAMDGVWGCWCALTLVPFFGVWLDLLLLLVFFL